MSGILHGCGNSSSSGKLLQTGNIRGSSTQTIENARFARLARANFRQGSAAFEFLVKGWPVGALALVAPNHTGGDCYGCSTDEPEDKLAMGMGVGVIGIRGAT